MLSKRAFTLLELILVVIILGILASLGLTNYTKTVEKSRIAEAKTILGQIRTAEEAYKLEYGGYTDSFSELGLDDLPQGTCSANYYFKYYIGRGPMITVAQATRCVTGEPGRSPYSGPAYYVQLHLQTLAWTQTGP